MSRIPARPASTYPRPAATGSSRSLPTLSAHPMTLSPKPSLPWNPRTSPSARDERNECCSRAEQHHIVPSPLVGEGKGEGGRSSAALRGVGPRTDSANRLVGCRDETTAVRVIPLSLSLPHKGGGNRVARTFATHD